MTGAPSLSHSLAPRLASVRVGLREDLDVTRHLFRGQPSYILRDPMTFQTQRLSLEDYTVFLAIDTGRPLSGVFEDLLKRGVLHGEDEERFYQFILSLHQLGFLRLPIADHALLYRRYQARQRAQRFERMTGFLFLRIPLWNPNAFLERTIRFARPLFRRVFFCCWLVLMAAAGTVVFREWHRLHEPLEGLLAAGNVPLLWITLIVLKAFHEFGHAYACKHLGGHVPEMGAYLILFTPCAYVDATAAWGFPRKSDRVIVSLAGMYVESIFAALAVLVWASTGPSWVHSLAYNVIFLAGVVTVLFNINPLMRYDGYYLLSDLLEIPNLREASTRYVLGVAKRVLLGLRDPSPPEGRGLRMVLLVFGIAAAIYRVGLVLGIAALLASRFFLGGLLIGALYVGQLLWKTIRRLIQYLWHAQETAPVRGRAIALGSGVLALLPACLAFLPVPTSVSVDAVVGRKRETVVRVRQAGFLIASQLTEGQHVVSGDCLAELWNDACLEEWEEAASRLAAARIRCEAARVLEVTESLEEQARIEALEAAARQRQQELSDLTVRAPEAGEVIEGVVDRLIGAFLPAGYPLATIASGGQEVRGFLTDRQFARVRPNVGDPVEFRSRSSPGIALQGTIQRIAPGALRPALASQVSNRGLQANASPASPQAINGEPLHEITIDLHGIDRECLRHGMTGSLRLRASAEPIASRWSRGLQRFIDQLSSH